MKIAQIGYNQSVSQVNSKPKAQKAPAFEAARITLKAYPDYFGSELIPNFIKAVEGIVRSVEYKTLHDVIPSKRVKEMDILTKQNVENVIKHTDDLGKNIDLKVNKISDDDLEELLGVIK